MSNKSTNQQMVAANHQHRTKGWLTGLAAASLVLVSGCTTVSEQVDLEAERAVKAQHDIATLDANSAVVPARPITLDEAIGIAFSNNLDLRVAEYEREVAREGAYAEKLNMLPDLNVRASRTFRDRRPKQDFLDTRTGMLQSSDVISSHRNRFNGDLSLTWNVLDFGLSYVRSRQAQMNLKAMDMRRLRQAQLLALDITESFWRAALAEDALDYIRAVESELRQQKQMIDLSVQERRIDPIAAKGAAKRLVELEITIRDLQAEVASARIELGRLMGLKRNNTFRLKREAIRPILARLPRPNQMRVGVLEEYALLNRTELFEQDIIEGIKRDDVRAAMLNMFPDLTFGIGAAYDNNNLLHADHWNTAAVNFGLNLLKLPAKYAQMEAREDDVEVAKQRRLQSTVTVLTQVNMALLDYALKADRFLLHEEAYSLANDLLNMVRDNNAVGRIADLTVTERVLEDLSSKLRRDQAVVDVLVAYRRMLASIGMDVEFWNGSLTDQSGLNNLFSDLPAPAVRRPVQPLPAHTAVPVQPVAAVPLPAIEPSRIVDLNAASTSSNLFPWVAQVGAFRNFKALKPRFTSARRNLPRLIDGDPIITTTNMSGDTVYRARYVGFTRQQAVKTCKDLKQLKMECWVDMHDPNTRIIDANASSAY